MNSILESPINHLLELENLKRIVFSLKEELSNNTERTNKFFIETENKIQELTNHEALSKTKKFKLTEPLQILIAHYLGSLNPIIELPVYEKDKVKLVSDMLKTGFENTKKYMRNIGVKGSLTYKEEHYDFLVDYFDYIIEQNSLRIKRTRKEML